MDCPVCPRRDIEEDQLYCPNCKTDLTPLLRTRELPLFVFNLALAHLQPPNANVEQAKSHLLLSIQLCPRLVEPRVVLGKLYAQQRNYLLALAQLRKAQKVDPTNEEVQQCISAIAERLGGRDAQDLCLEANYKGKPVYLWSTLQFLDGNKSSIWRLIPKKAKKLAHIVLRTGGVFHKYVTLHSEQIKEVDQETVLVNLQSSEVKFLPRCQSDTTLARAVEKALSTYGLLQATEGTGVRVEVNNGKVALSGNVRSEVNRKLAREIARSVSGVVEVRDTIYSDSRLELALARRLASRLNSAGIFVTLFLGQVFLEGEVSSASASEVVESIALSTKGVRTVVNHLDVTASGKDGGCVG